ncbi:Vesicle-associated membrane protein 4 [Borealophlyctis nickersoniae]|nr:Vesicle-associated membrane protein 4 [Borealophlyctis nickersoniae]
MSAPATTKGYAPVSSSVSAAEVQNNIDEVIAIAQDNINKAVRRGDNLDQLQNKCEEQAPLLKFLPLQADNLQNQAGQFKKRAHDVRRKMWWQNLKWQLILAAVILLILTIIVVVVLWQTGALHGSSAPPPPPPPAPAAAPSP